MELKVELKELLEDVFNEAYKMGKQDGLNGIHMTPKIAFEQFMSEQNIKVETDICCLVDLRIAS